MYCFLLFLYLKSLGGGSLKRKKETVFLCSQKKDIQLSQKRKRSEIPLICINGAHKDKKFVKVEEKKDNLICQIFEN